MRVQREDRLSVAMIEWRYVGLNISALPQDGDVGGGGLLCRLKSGFIVSSRMDLQLPL